MMLFSLFKGTFSTAYVKWKNKYVLITWMVVEVPRGTEQNHKIPQKFNLGKTWSRNNNHQMIQWLYLT